MRNSLKRNIRGEEGYMMVVSLVLVGLVSISGIIISDYANALIGQSHRARVLQSVETVRAQALAGIYNDAAWTTQTAVGNECMATGNNCNPNAEPSSFTLRDLKGEAIVSNVESTGFNLRGRHCVEFSSNGNDSCPFRLAMTWQPIRCNGTTKCLVEVVGQFIFTGTDSAYRILNAERFNIRMIRGQEKGSVREACVLTGGEFDQTRGTCDLPPYTATCPQGQYLIQASTGGLAKCRPVLGYGPTCPLGAAAIGIKSDGSLDCRSPLDWRL